MLLTSLKIDFHPPVISSLPTHGKTRAKRKETIVGQLRLAPQSPVMPGTETETMFRPPNIPSPIRIGSDFMPRACRDANSLPNVAWQQWRRIPNVYNGAAVGGATGAAGAVFNNCTCPQ